MEKSTCLGELLTGNGSHYTLKICSHYSEAWNKLFRKTDCKKCLQFTLYPIFYFTVRALRVLLFYLSQQIERSRILLISASGAVLC